MKCVIVDDEHRGREVLASLLSTHCPEVTICGTADDVASAYEIISRLKPDLVFLDIEMPDGTGFDLLQKFDHQQTFQTVFVTSYDQYAIKAVRSHAFDYLLKPVIVDELKSTIRQLASVQKPQPIVAEDELLEINYKTRLDYVRRDQILWLKGDGNYTLIYATNNKTYHTSKILRDYEEILCKPDSGFVRTHKSAIINLLHVQSYEHGTSQGLVLAGGTVIEVARRKKEEVLDQLRRYRSRNS